MAIAESDGMRLAYIAEATENTTPATPAFQTVRYTGESIKQAKNVLTSDEIRADKNRADLLKAGIDVAGSVDTEFSYGTYDDWFEGLFRSTYSTNVLTNGLVRKSFTFEKTTEEGATDSFYRYKGCFIDSLSMSIAARQKITCSWGILGMSSDPGATAIIAGATYTAATTEEIMPAGTYVGSVALTGIATQPAILSIDIQINSNMRPQTQIGSDDLAGVAQGLFEVSGTIRFYAEGIEVYDAVRNHDADDLTIPLGVVTTEKYTLQFPNIRFGEGDIVSGGAGTDLIFDVTFTAIYDSGSGGTAVLTRAIA